MQQFDRNFLSFSSLHLQTHQYLHSLLLRKSRCLLPVSKTPNSLFLSYQSSTGFFPTAHNMPLTAAVLQGKGGRRGSFGPTQLWALCFSSCCNESESPPFFACWRLVCPQGFWGCPRWDRPPLLAVTAAGSFSRLLPQEHPEGLVASSLRYSLGVFWPFLLVFCLSSALVAASSVDPVLVLPGPDFGSVSLCTLRMMPSLLWSSGSPRCPPHLSSKPRLFRASGFRVQLPASQWSTSRPKSSSSPLPLQPVPLPSLSIQSPYPGFSSEALARCSVARPSTQVPWHRSPSLAIALSPPCWNLSTHATKATYRLRKGRHLSLDHLPLYAKYLVQYLNPNPDTVTEHTEK